MPNRLFYTDSLITRKVVRYFRLDVLFAKYRAVNVFYSGCDASTEQYTDTTQPVQCRRLYRVIVIGNESLYHSSKPKSYRLYIPYRLYYFEEFLEVEGFL